MVTIYIFLEIKLYTVFVLLLIFSGLPVVR